MTRRTRTPGFDLLRPMGAQGLGFARKGREGDGGHWWRCIVGRRDRHVRGIVEVPVVKCTYLVRADAIPELTYEEESGRHEYRRILRQRAQGGHPAISRQPPIGYAAKPLHPTSSRYFGSLTLKQSHAVII